MDKYVESKHINNPQVVQMQDGSWAGEGDVVEDKCGTNWTFLRLNVNYHNHIVELASRKHYLSPNTIAYYEKNCDTAVYPNKEALARLLATQTIEESIVVPVDEFITTYKIVGKWNPKDHEPLSDDESAMIDAILEESHEKIRCNLKLKKWNEGEM